MLLSRRTMLALGATLALSGFALSWTPVYANPEIGQNAPAFAAKDTKGKDVSLASLRGKTVVLEWTNDGCPYVAKHYGAGNMQKLQADARADGVVWISIVSSKPGAQGHVTPAEADELTDSRGAKPAHVILDEKGIIGRKYQARTTPHMFVIDPEGTLVFKGGIDDTPTADRSSIAGATNYVTLALDAVSKGESVATPVARPYGCSIKYAPEARS